MVIIQIIKTFLFSSSVYSCHLFLISSASVKVFAVSALYTAHTCMKYSLDISSFLEEISSLSHSIVFLYFFAFSLRKPSFISPCYSLELCIPLSIFFPCLLLLYFPQLLVRPLQTTTLPSCISFSLGWFWSLPPVQCYEPPSIVLQTLCLPDLIPWIYLSPSLYNHKGFELGHSWIA